MLAITSETPKSPLWRRWGLQLKFAVSYIILIGAVLLFLNTYPVLASQDLVFQSKRDSLQSQASLFSSGLGGLDSITSTGASQVMEQLSLGALTQVVVTDERGIVVYDTDQSAGSVGTLCVWPELLQALKDRADVCHYAFRDRAFQTVAAAPVTVGGVVTGGVCLFEYDTAQAGLILDIQNNLRNVSIVVAILAVVLSLVLSKALTRRIEGLLKAIRLVREGEYSHRVTIPGQDELAQLGGEFNQLTHRLQTTEEARRRFVSDASHELKTPLATIRLLTDSILQSDSMDPATLREFIGDIGQEAERLTRITEKLLTLTKIDAQAVAVPDVPTAVAPVVQKAAHMLSPLAKQSEVEIRLALDDKCQVLCDEDGLYQIAFNLMENAVKYNLPGGWVEARLEQDEEAVRLTVSDTGVGVPADELTHIFDRFYRVDKARSRAAGGTGLGLSIVQDTARAHGGSVIAAPRPEGQGISFTVVFPK